MGFSFRSRTSVHCFSLFLIFNLLPGSSRAANNTITRGQLLRDGQTLVSAGQIFELGFFSPANSTSRYVGIWYHGLPVQTVVWVANRENPISDDSGLFSIASNGNFMVSNGNGAVLWTSNSSSSSSSSGNFTAVLMDNGNLILYIGDFVGNENNALWQSSDHTTDTYLPELRVAFSGEESHPFTSWKSSNNPARGNYSMGIDSRVSPQVVMWENSTRLWRSGHWNGLIFTGIPSMRALLFYGFRLSNEGNGQFYFTFTMMNSSILMRFVVTWDGTVKQLIWDESEREWNASLSEPSNDCERYNYCGNHGICDIKTSPICSCIEGFVPNLSDQWRLGNWSSGCIRRTPLECGQNGTGNDGFYELDSIKLPDFADSNSAQNLGGCQGNCLRNCSCNAYAFVTGIGCMTWSGNLVDVEHFEAGGQTLYIRLASSEFGNSRLSTAAKIVIAVAAVIFLGLIGLLLWIFMGKLKEFPKSWQKINKPLISEAGKTREHSSDLLRQDKNSDDGKECNEPQLPLFSFHYVEVATDYFANKNKLGEGGFGPVYKGTLAGGQEVAVKRLSKWSGQGSVEFKNEMTLIAKLQHRNLVRLLGCCVERGEKMLIYEYMPHKSLDSFLFDPEKKKNLDWRTRFLIIEGIARGLLYLHRDSRLRIIHRDLKVSNILLDKDMNPKISDFGMARIFGGNQNEANTNRVVGTYGYMPPEYAMEGLFSVKSDVYSFGVLMLEIVSGQRNNRFRSPEASNLIGHAWNMWKQEKPEELIDPSVAEACSTMEALKCIHVAMLCVQLSTAHRPTMASVILMLESENASLPQPVPSDITSRGSMEMNLIMDGHDISVSSNDVTVTEVIGR